MGVLLDRYPEDDERKIMGFYSSSQMALALSSERIEWDSLCGMINQNWPRHADLIDTAMAETDRNVLAAGGDPEIASEYPAYYAMATQILRGLLTEALRCR